MASSKTIAAKVRPITDFAWVKDGRRVVKVMKLNHTERQQVVTLIPTPRIATQQFYDDWLYQPYLKDHLFAVSDDTLAIVYNPPTRWMCGKGKWKDVEPVSLLRIPDALDCGLTNTEGYNRSKSIFSHWRSMMFVPISWRDQRPAWLKRQFTKLLGKTYLVHPVERDRSYVVVIPAPQANHAVATLNNMGFVESTSVEVDAGPDDQVSDVERACDLFNKIFNVYFIAIVCVSLYGAGTYFHSVGLEELAKEKAEAAQREAQRQERVDAANALTARRTAEA